MKQRCENILQNYLKYNISNKIIKGYNYYYFNNKNYEIYYLHEKQDKLFCARNI